MFIFIFQLLIHTESQKQHINDIKTGKSSLNKSQRRIRDAIKANKVSFELINLDEVINNDKIDEEQKN